MNKLVENILFLDIDGVISTSRSLWKAFAKDLDIDISDEDFSNYTHCIDGINPLKMKEIMNKIESGEYKFPNYMGYKWPYDKICIEYLNKIIEENNAYIVVISSRRIGYNIQQLQDILDKEGVKGKVIGRTGTNKTRALEILGWLNIYNDKYDIRHICILDDESYYDIDYIFYEYTVGDMNTNELGLKEKHIQDCNFVFSKNFDIDEINFISENIDNHKSHVNSKHK